MEAQALPLPITFGQLKAEKFRNIPEPTMKGIAYIEQLSSMTQQNIESWPILEMLQGVDLADKRKLNSIFFEAAKEKPTVLDPKIKLAVDAVSKIMADNKKSMIETAKENRIYALDQAHAYYGNYTTKLAKAFQLQLELDRLNGNNETRTHEEVQKILTAGFWSFKASYGSALDFTTTNEVVMREFNKKLNVDRKVNLGKYMVRLDCINARIHVFTCSNNVEFNNCYHPYISSRGEICWGNASDRASGEISQGNWATVMEILASLLMNYEHDTTPYVRLYELEAKRNGTSPEICEHCDELRENCECDICSTCERPTDDCNCSYCEACETTVPEGETCGGNWCPQCEECYGREHCDDHFCTHCNEYTPEVENCRNGCCHECGEQDGHSTGCSGYEPPSNETEREEIPF